MFSKNKNLEKPSLKLDNFGVAEMNAEEVRKVEGGIGWVLAVAFYVIADWDSISAGFSDGFNGRSYYYQQC